MSELPEVELRTAIVFTCEECGRDNYSTPVSIDKEQHWDTILEHAGEDLADMMGDIELWPDEVECVFCGQEFRAIARL